MHSYTVTFYIKDDAEVFHEHYECVAADAEDAIAQCKSHCSDSEIVIVSVESE